MNQKIRLIRTFSIIGLIIILILNTIRVIQEKNNVIHDKLQEIEESISWVNLQVSWADLKLWELEIQKKNIIKQKSWYLKTLKELEFKRDSLKWFLSGYIETISDTWTAIDKLEEELNLPQESAKINIAPRVSAAYVKPAIIPSWKKITHKWYTKDDYRQQIIQETYDIWWIRQVILQECESGMNPLNVWDKWAAYWLCQMNSNYHAIPSEYYKDRQFQIEYCNHKMLWWTKFYWPDRKMYADKAKTIYLWLCKDVVLSRFIIE